MDWKIYYGNGSAFSSDDGGVWEAPSHDVVCVVHKTENGRQCLNTWDWYIYRSDVGWWGVDMMGMVDQVMHFTDKVMGVKQGRCIPDQDYYEIMSRARSDPDFPKQTARKKNETGNQCYGPGKNE